MSLNASSDNEGETDTMVEAGGGVRAGLMAVLALMAASLLMALPLMGQTLVPVVEAGSVSVPEIGVSHTLAIERAARLSGLHYKINFSLEPQAAKTHATETVTFTDSGAGDLPIDFRDGDLESATLNGKELLTQTVNDHLMLPASALQKGENVLKIAYSANIAVAGKAITRYQDRDDGNEYVYTLFVPMDASMAFPCFDQPDLKGQFTLQVTAPTAWTVIANSSATGVTRSGASSQWTFAETRPISTYLFAFAAGPFESVHPTAGQPKLYVRKSQAARARAEAPQVQAIAARGIDYLSTYFAQPFPFPKYDLVLIPGFPFGGMEHAGATFLNEDGVLFRTAPTESDRFRRNILVLHETTHQWFGDLVTMRWFDDLWLKEGFAQYMAYRALARLEPQQNPWKHFYEEIKPQAYGIDETQGTTPIFQNILNLKDAKSAYGAIVYQKAPAVLKQLEFRIGPDSFREGLRAYLKDHAYGNAQWSDLIAAFKAAGSDRAGTSLAAGAHPASDLDAWADAWIKHRGMPQVDVSWACSAGKITELTLKQHDVLNNGAVWPISNQVTLQDAAKTGAAARLLREDWNEPSFTVKAAAGLACPAFVFPNAGDEAYGRFLLDAKSEPAAAQKILHTPLAEQDPLLRSMLWGALFENVHVAQSPPRAYVERALEALPAESDESLARIQGGRVATAFHAYMTDAGRAALVPRMEMIAEDGMLHAPTLGLRIVSFHTFTSVAETPKALGQLKALLEGSVAIPGLMLRPLDRWNMVGHLVAMNDAQAATVLAAEKAKDTSGEGQKYAYAVEASAPDAAGKARYFEEYLRVPGPGAAAGAVRQEDWITQSLRPFNSWNQSALTEPYLTRALDALPEIKLHRKIFFLGAWLGAFVDGQHSAEAQAAVHAWLARKEMDPDLRLKVLEVSDELDRTVMIRQRFPE